MRTYGGGISRLVEPEARRDGEAGAGRDASADLKVRGYDRFSTKPAHVRPGTTGYRWYRGSALAKPH